MPLRATGFSFAFGYGDLVQLLAVDGGYVAVHSVNERLSIFSARNPPLVWQRDSVTAAAIDLCEGYNCVEKRFTELGVAEEWFKFKFKVEPTTALS